MTLEKSPLCAICSQRVAIYTCPRCATRSCSAACSKSHKELQPCSGERDKTAFVPMNKYGWGTMASDYAYLEEVGRKSAEWGVDIINSGLLAEAASSYRGRGRGRQRGRGGQISSARNGGAKRDFLRMQLQAREIEMESLPPGMEKRRLNQSSWDAKLKGPLMTVEFLFHQPTHSVTACNSSDTQSFSILTHRNGLHMTLREIMTPHLLGRKKKDTLPLWLQSLLPSPGEDDEVQFDFIMAQPSQETLGFISKAFQKLDADSSLSNILCHKTFVEYPTIEVWAEGSFKGPLIDVDGTYIEAEEAIRSAKRYRVNAAEGREVIATLLGGYSSNEDDGGQVGGEKDDEENVLTMLGGYGTDEEAEYEYAQIEAPIGDDTEGASPEDDETFEKPTMEDICEIFEVIGDPLIQHDIIESDEDEDEDEDENEGGLDWGESEDEDEVIIRALERQKASHHTG
ncbi:hypothetical protein BU17DRAFT_37024 [Hysterangium stoloniferum]|nr:hypothetical protein BU17DRAFT_37024 [Hysterangium stoloniferum]